jgi:hypothetical protein
MTLFVPPNLWPVITAAVAGQAGSGTHWANIFTSVGTVGAAGLAGVGLLIAVSLARQDRSAAERRLEDERRHTREQSARQFQAQLLLRAGELYAAAQEPYSPEGLLANRQIRAVLRALPETMCTIMRVPFGLGGDPGSPAHAKRQEVLARIASEGTVVSASGNPELAFKELADNIAEVTSVD